MTTGIGKQNRRNRMKLIDADELKKKKKHSKEFAENIVSVAEIDWQPTVDAIPVEWLYALAEKKESEKDIKLSLMIKGVVALWHREQEEENEINY